MGILTWLKKRIRARLAAIAAEEARRVVDPAVANAVRKCQAETLRIASQLDQFHQSPPEDRQSFHDHTMHPSRDRDVYPPLRDRLARAGVGVEDVELDVDGFRKWMGTFPELVDYYRRQGKPMADVVVEKCLEHYLSSQCLQVRSGEVFVDVAAAGSPYVELLRARGVEAYKLDMGYPAGRDGVRIGADACHTGLPDGFASALASHCAFECFQGDADTRFVTEAGRILDEHGRYAILPLYVESTHAICTSPYCCQDTVTVDEGARRIWREDVFHIPFNRIYSPESFHRRVHAHVPDDMHGKVLFVRNLDELMQRYPDQRLYCFFVYYCRKRSPS